MGKAAFFAPDTGISPLRRRPPEISNLSILLCLEFVGGQGLHRQRVNFGTHAMAQGRGNGLVAGNTPFSSELGTDNDGLEMVAIAPYLEVRASEVIGNILLDLFRRGQHNVQLRNL